MSPKQLTDCVGMPDEAACTAGVREGICVDEVCLPKGCGDFRRSDAEECDGDQFIRNATDCLDIGFYQSGPIACRSDCTIDTSQCGIEQCGDGVLDSDKNEICEPSLPETATTCDALGFYNNAAVPCTVSCRYDVKLCEGFCGDNITNGPELCDGTSALPSYVSCLDYGFDAGQVSCSSGCFAETSACRHHQLTPTGIIATTQLEGIYLTSPSTGYVAGYDGTGNGRLAFWDGRQVTPITIPDGAAFRDISGTSATDIVVVGAGGRIGRYNGTTYTDATISSTEAYSSVHMISPTDGYVVGLNSAGTSTGVIRRWNGTSWVLQTLPVTIPSFSAVYATSPTDIWAVGAGGTILHSNGTTWTVSPSGTGALIYDVWGSSSSDVYVVGTAGMLRRFNGTSWSAMSSPANTSMSLDHIWGTSATNVWALSTFDLLHYDGQHWVKFAVGNVAGSTGAAWDSSHNVVALGNGSLLRWDGAGWLTPALLASQPYRFWGTSETNIYLAAQSAVLRYDGSTWTQVATGAGLQSIWGTGPNDIWAGGDSTILHYNGTAWTSTTVGSQFIQGIWGSSPTNVWTIGDSGEIHHFDGTQWTLSIDISNDGHELWGSSASDVWMAGDEMWHYNGTTWSMYPMPTAGFQDIWGTNASNVYTVTGPDVWHFNGTAWAKLDVPNFYQGGLLSVNGTGPDDVWVTGTDVVLHYDGTSWQRVNPPTHDTFFDVWATPGDIHLANGAAKMVQTLRRSCLTCGL